MARNSLRSNKRQTVLNSKKAESYCQGCLVSETANVNNNIIIEVNYNFRLFVLI